MLAQEFELKTSEQLMLARQLNIRSKEMLTVSRLRMLRENADRAGNHSKLWSTPFSSFCLDRESVYRCYRYNTY